MRKLGDRIELLDNTHKLEKSGNGFYLRCLHDTNSLIFRTLGIDKFKIQFSTLGYTGNGDFPYCKTLEDLNKFIDAIIRNINKEEQLNYEIY